MYIYALIDENETMHWLDTFVNECFQNACNGKAAIASVPILRVKECIRCI